MADAQQSGEESLGLDEVLDALNRDLVAARGRGGETVGLGVEKVEVELSVQVGRSGQAGAEAGVKWFVVSAQARGGGEWERRNTHRITLTLAPAGSEGVLPDAVADTPEPPSGDVLEQ